MRKLIIVIMILFLGVSVAYGYDKEWIVTMDQFEDFEIKTDGVKLNNFSIKESAAFLAPGMLNINVSFSARNKLDASKHFSVMMVGVAKGKVLWALDLEPMMSTISAKKTESINGSSYVPPGTLEKTTKIWIRVVGDI
jgi:hypothetical protein